MSSFVQKLNQYIYQNKPIYIYQNALNFLYYFNKKRRLTRLNKKLVYIFAVLVAGLFVVSACEQAVGVRPAKPLEEGNFIDANYYLKVSVNPRNSGYIRPGGREISRSYISQFPSDTKVTLRAISRGNWTFEKWSGDVAKNDRTNINIIIIMDRDKKIIANFRRV